MRSKTGCAGWTAERTIISSSRSPFRSFWRESERFRGGNQRSPATNCRSLISRLTLRHARSSRAGQPIEVTAKEFALLEYLMRHPGQVFSRSVIAEHVWNYDFDSVTNVIDVHIKNLRRKVDGPFETKLIHTVRGVGYRISDRAS
jgi:DNA-binding response OmpR family regulator